MESSGTYNHKAAEGIHAKETSPGEDLLSMGSVTCFYNEEDIAEETLENLEEAASQSDFYETIYAVDDGSEDSTAEIIEEYASDSEVVEFLEMEENTGKFGAQKHCTEQMEEDYWLSIDADSYIENPDQIDQTLLELDQSSSSAAALKLKPETEGEGFLSRAYEKLQKLEYARRRGIDDFTSNGSQSEILMASGAATLGETKKIEEAMKHHSGKYPGDDTQLCF